MLAFLWLISCNSSKPLCLNDISNNPIVHFDNSSYYTLGSFDARLIRLISSAFGYDDLNSNFSPKVVYYDDSSMTGHNAFAYQGWSKRHRLEKAFRNYPISYEGYILLGKNMAAELAPVVDETQRVYFAYPYILAHEIAHIVQYNAYKDILVSKNKTGPFKPSYDFSKIQSKDLELNADYAAGIFYSIYLRNLLKNIAEESNPLEKEKLKIRRSKILKAVNNYICGLGNKLGSAESHGTCKERQDAFNMGRNRFYEESFLSIPIEIANHLQKKSITAL